MDTLFPFTIRGKATGFWNLISAVAMAAVLNGCLLAFYTSIVVLTINALG